MKHLIIFIMFISCCSLYAEKPSGKVIMERVDSNYVSENRKAVTTMIIKGRRGTRTLKAQSWIHGTKKSFTEYLLPPREKGIKMLKLGDELWIYSPSTDRTIRIAGHMLRQSLMGSDVSYEDYMEDPRLTNIYEPILIGEEKIDDRNCYILELTAKKEDVAYHSRKMWVDKERYLPLREERYAKGGKLLKSLVINKIFKVGERWYPKKMTFKDELKQGSGTEFIIDSIEFNVKIPDHIFSKASLRR